MVQNLIFYNTPPWMIIRICRIKTLIGKTLVKEKEYNILLNYYNCLIKNLDEGKRVQCSDILIN